MAMTYLELCNKLIQKCAISGGELTAVTGLTGESGRVVAWIDEAYSAIQMIHPNWNWMQKDYSFETIEGQSSYTPAQCGITDFGEWKPDSHRSYITSVGVASEDFLRDMEYDAFRNTYLFGNMRLTQGRPLHVSVSPANSSLNLGLTPDSIGYTVGGQYYHEPLHLVEVADTPTLPSKYHMIVVYRAMMYYGAYEAASDVYNEGSSAYNELVRKLNNEQLQDVEAGSL